MPLWLLIVVIAVGWVGVIVVIVLFMMGASKGRARERAALANRPLEAAGGDPDRKKRGKDEAAA